jgi:hypothetical protein
MITTLHNSGMTMATRRRLTRAVLSTLLFGLLVGQVPHLAAEPKPAANSAAAFRAEALRDMIATTAAREGVDPALVEAVVAVESAFLPLAVSPKGAMGLMQLMPDTARRYGVVNAFDPRQNLSGGTRHLKDLLHLFSGDLPHALAAYNAGAQAVMIHRGIPPYRETQAYVRMVLARYQARRAAPPSVARAAEPPVRHVAVVRAEAPADAGSDLRQDATRLVMSEGHSAPLIQVRHVPTVLVKSRAYPAVRPARRH